MNRVLLGENRKLDWRFYMDNMLRAIYILAQTSLLDIKDVDG
jgi:hypothetical protein